MINENPKIIYLLDETENYDPDHGRAWCEDKINEDDVKYIRADLVEKINPKSMQLLKESIEYLEICDDTDFIPSANQAEELKSLIKKIRETIK